ncbi:hypothetical protein SAMN05421676_102107 [Salinibacillus kushneri]|uniref:Outer surface protein n=1 Tax=Salinibacillus kushneri TaxID=237682 RepID=A0A1I0ADA0_9BACI|nr:MupG family TIM beta-alpha barrel fold protein [Salinibacillus kushneri]SES91739.1 hypothetical protein SAMN05421676_102107 [Salinibacillus kushneri]
MLGVSIYLSNHSVTEQESYIQSMSKLGFTSIFTSLHIPEDNPETYKKGLVDLGKLAKTYDMELFADISPKSLDYLGFPWDNAHHLKEWGLTGLRVDYGISDETIAALSNKMKVALNASTITHENMEALRKNGTDFSRIEAWHNYYPRPETGLSIKDFNEKNKFLKAEGLTVMAFIPGDGEQRGPVYQGLPTIEAHRNRSSFSSFMEFHHNQWVDKILIGDPSINEDSKRQFADYRNQVVRLRAKPYTTQEDIKNQLQEKQTNRLDPARDVIRSAESRQYGLIGHFPVQANHTGERTEGSITIDNEKYGRYQGEIQITKRNLPADEKVNVIGRVIPEDRYLLPYIKGGVAFKMEWTE